MTEANLVGEQEKIELEEKVIQIDRVTRVVKGGRRLRFRATVVVGDKNGQVGVACEKAGDVSTAITKSVARAKRNMVGITLHETTIPHQVTAEFAGAKVFLKPARKGTGVIAGGAVRAVLEVAGVRDILSKIYGSSSKLNNVYATMKALRSLEEVPETAGKPFAKDKKEEDKKTAGESDAKKKAAGKAAKRNKKDSGEKEQKPKKAEAGKSSVAKEEVPNSIKRSPSTSSGSLKK